MANSSIKKKLLVIKNDVYADGTSLPSTYPIGITVEITRSASADLPLGYGLLITIKGVSARVFQIATGGTSAMAIRTGATTSSSDFWDSWKTVTTA